MARMALIEREKKRRDLVLKSSAKRAMLKAIIKNKNSSNDERFKAQQGLQKLSRNSSKTRVRNRCKIDGRPRGYMRDFGISRVKFRKLALDGTLPGVMKASW